MDNLEGFARTGLQAFQSARDYRLAMALQQMQAGMQAEKLRMDQESATFENEKTRLATEQAKFTLEKSKYNLEQTKQIEKDIDTAAEAMAPKPSVAGTGVKAIRAGKKVSLPSIERLGKERAGQRAMTRIGLRKAPGQVLFPKEPKERSFADRISEIKFSVYQNPDAWPEEYRGWAFGRGELPPKTEIGGIPIGDVIRTADTLYPFDPYSGTRFGAPEGVDPNSYEFLEYVAGLMGTQKPASKPTGIDYDTKYKIEPE